MNTVANSYYKSLLIPAAYKIIKIPYYSILINSKKP